MKDLLKNQDWEEEFADRFSELQLPNEGDCSLRVKVFIQRLLTSSHSQFLDEVIRVAGGMKKRGKSYWAKVDETGGINPVASMARGTVDGYNQALSDLIATLKEAK